MMEVILKANTENTLSADETRALAAHIQGLQQRLDAAQVEIAALTTALDRAHQRADEAEANTDRIRDSLGWIITELTGELPDNANDAPRLSTPDNGVESEEEQNSNMEKPAEADARAGG